MNVVLHKPSKSVDNIKSCLAARASGETVLQKQSPARPQVLHMALNLPHMSGKQCVQQLKELLSETQVLVLTVCENDEEQALRAGPKGYLLKRTTPDKVLEAVCKVDEGSAHISSQVAYWSVRSFHEPTLTKLDVSALTVREKEILTLLSQGLANKEIANKSRISVPTVRTHLRHIYGKLNIRSRSEAIIKYLQ